MAELPIVPDSNNVPYHRGRDFDLGDFICQALGTRRFFITRAKAWYMQGRRYYHSFDHALDVASEVMMAGFDVFLEHPQELLVAAIYHDAIYVPGAKDNEERSADLAVAEMKEMEMTDIDAEYVARLINLTSKHFTDVHLSDEEAIFMDADIHGFAAPWDIFGELQESIDSEFLISGERAAVAKGRDAFLVSILNSEHIFYSKRGRKLYEPIARKNLQRYLDLGAGAA
jgi:predicted metal-dependent HD superfamily phosphohydrolase